MPYTPPSQQSPAPSNIASPAPSRPQSFIEHAPLPTPSPGPRPGLPRSTSSTAYLQKSRRSPAFQKNDILSTQVADSAAAADGRKSDGLSINTALRQSPPPLSSAAMPPGAVLSPPESSQNSSDEEDGSLRTNGRRITKLEELGEVIRRSLQGSPLVSLVKEESATEQNAASSDVPEVVAEVVARTNGLKIQLRTAGGEEISQSPPKLTEEARRISHSRSATDSSIILSPPQLSVSNSDMSDDDEQSPHSKPPLLRKKSGELVKPAIRPTSQRKHSSMPGTPTFSKAVHFNDDMEQVRHFLQIDRPIAVSAGPSPVEAYDDENEFPFGFGAGSGATFELRLANFPRESLERQSLPVRLEKIYLTTDHKGLIGEVAVANIAFHKLVVARFTFDYWKTTSEVVAEFHQDVRGEARDDGYDQFRFNISLLDQANLETKTLLICVRYNVNGQELWDNNNGMNFQVDFSKRQTPVPQQSGARALGASPIPRSRHHPPSTAKQRSVPSFDDDFAESFDAGTTFRFRGPSSAKQIIPDTPPRRVNPAGQPFGSRYDFGASLTAALSQAQATLGDRSGVRQAQERTRANGAKASTASPPSGSTSLSRSGMNHSPIPDTDSPRSDALLASKQSLDSRAYQEFVSKFCFFGSGKPGEIAAEAKMNPPSHDGAQDDARALLPSSSSNGPESTMRWPAKNRYLNVNNGFTGHVPPSKGLSPNDSGSSSPSPPHNQPASPQAFGYPFHSNGRHEMFSPEASTPTAIRG